MIMSGFFVMIVFAELSVNLLYTESTMSYPYITISISQQQLTLHLCANQSNVYTISTGKNGIGQLENTGCTPLGLHTISEKFGDGLPLNSVFVARKFTGEIYDDNLASAFPARDWILTRILWLDGCELGFNKGENTEGICDTKSRYIYIHGTPDTEPMGIPLSHGCIRMRNHEIIDLFDKVDIGTSVQILP